MYKIILHLTGSILGPLSFLLHINDLPVNIQGSKLVSLAENINLLVIEKDESALQHKIKNVTMELESWFYKNNSSVIAY
jgi:hypothetical protein